MENPLVITSSQVQFHAFSETEVRESHKLHHGLHPFGTIVETVSAGVSHLILGLGVMVMDSRRKKERLSGGIKHRATPNPPLRPRFIQTVTP